jgi:cold-inducible RNA-binding protein
MTTRLFIDNLPASIREEDLDQMFSMYGKVQCLYLAGEWESPLAWRFAFIDMEKERDAMNALSGLQDSIIGGKKVRIVLSRTELQQAC